MTVYVRKEEEKVYNALMLENLTMNDLKEAVSVLLSCYTFHPTKYWMEFCV